MLDYNLKLNIINNVQKSIPNKKDTKTYYRINISIKDQGNDVSWEIDKSYEEFETLYTQIKNNHPLTVPKFPSKGLITIKSTTQIVKRQENLNKFLKECLEKNDIIEDFSFIKFIDIINHSKTFIKKVSFVDKFVSLSYRISGLLLLKKDLFFAILNNPDRHLNKKELKELGNINTVNSNLVAAPGKLLAFGLVKSWLKRFNSIDVVFNYVVNVVYISGVNIYAGMESGHTSIIKMIFEDNEPNMLVKEFKTHNSKIIGIGSNDIDAMYTVSSKTIKITALITHNLLICKFYFNIDIFSYIV